MNIGGSGSRATWLRRSALLWRRWLFRLYRHLAEPRWQQGRTWMPAVPEWSQAHQVSLRRDGVEVATARLVSWRKL
jgi:hypothetical protein